MKNFLLATLLMGAAMPVYAWASERIVITTPSVEVKSEVPEYDVLDKSKLQNKIGLEAGMEPEKGMVVSVNPQGVMAEPELKPVIIDQATTVQNTTPVVTTPMQEPIQEEVIVTTPPTIIVERVAVGNTDTGVDMDEIQPLLDEQ